ncbi:MAG: winged helix-turn-helix transcriptional regulator [Enhydrobacter sp.]|nr:winged helix-turn-helix transcriptional regulator [Enhydrobacter sp.]
MHAVNQSCGMPQKVIAEKALATLLEQAFRLTHSSEHAEGLYPAQWTALRFVANSRGAPPTASRLARFQGMSLGPVSRTVRTLIDKGLLKRVDVGGRTETLALTHTGRLLMERDPAQRISRAMSSLEPTQREALAQALESVIRNLLVAPTGSSGNESESANSTDRLQD